jgi:hypothetical protein
MSAISPKVGYQSVNTGTLVKSGPAGLYGIISTVTGGAITVYDNTAASGTILFTKTLAVGDVIHFGGNGIAAKNGLYVSVTGTCNILYT